MKKEVLLGSNLLLGVCALSLFISGCEQLDLDSAKKKELAQENADLKLRVAALELKAQEKPVSRYNIVNGYMGLRPETIGTGQAAARVSLLLDTLGGSVWMLSHEKDSYAFNEVEVFTKPSYNICVDDPKGLFQLKNQRRESANVLPGYDLFFEKVSQEICGSRQATPTPAPSGIEKKQ